MTERVGIIGGTGDLGTALAVHLSRNYVVTIGSRKEERAREALETIKKEKGERDYFLNLKAASNEALVSSCELLILTVPEANAVETVRSLAPLFRATDQILVSAVASVSKNASGSFVSSSTREKASITEQIRSILPTEVGVASAFQTLPAGILYREREISADVLICAEEERIYEKVKELVASIKGLRPLYLGGLELSAELESLTALLLNVAVRNRLRSPTLKLNSF